MAEQKRGRKPKSHRTADGKTIDGLRKRPVDGRWELRDGRMFTEPDEAKAVERFYRMTSTDTVDTYIEKRLQSEPYGKHHQIWKWFAEQIRTRPQWVAEATGIEQLGYLDQLQPPETIPTLAEIENTWKTHYTKTAKAKVLHAWADFKRTTGVVGLKDITPETAIAYRDNFYSRGRKAKGQANVFSRIRRLFSFARDREIAPATLAKVLDALQRLTPNDTTVTLDPKPIEAEDWKTLLDNATKPEDRAMILLMLNGGYYCSEVVSLKWEMIAKGCIVTNRNKEGRCLRVCVLWAETIEALEAVARKSEYIFMARTGKQLGVKGAEKRFRVLRDLAGLTDLTSSQLRDGAAQAMGESEVKETHQAIVMGHRSGMADRYVRRNPKMVGAACQTIYAMYMR